MDYDADFSELEEELLQAVSYPGRGLHLLLDEQRDAPLLEPSRLVDWQEGRIYRAIELECLLRYVLDIVSPDILSWAQTAQKLWHPETPPLTPYGPQIIFVQASQDDGFVSLRRLESVNLGSRERPFDTEEFLTQFNAFAEHILGNCEGVDLILLGRDLSDLLPGERTSALNAFEESLSPVAANAEGYPAAPALVFDVIGRGGFRCLYPIEALTPRNTLGLFEVD